MTQFSSLGLSEPIQRAVQEKGYQHATPIQEKAIPVIIAGHDILAAAQTGTGKTAGFTLPLLQRLSLGEPATNRAVRALVLTPTRELAAQVGESVETYGQHLPLRSAVIFGGVSINPQMMKLRGGVDILVATPGRLLDLHSQNAVVLSKVEILVLDEADRMLDMGFIHDIRRILKLLPAKRQNLLFSATFSDEIRQLSKGILHNPISIDVAPRNSTVTSVQQTVYQVDKADKPDILSYLIQSGGWEQVLVFTRTKHGANKLAQQLERDGITSAAIHGNKSQGARTRALADFKASEVRVLVATDIAARGLDIEQLPHVVNYELPNVPEDYVHRIGRTGRAGASGEAISLVSPEERKLQLDIERLLKRKLDVQPVPYFEPGEKKPMVALDDDRPARQPQTDAPRRPPNRSRPPAGAQRAKTEGGGRPSSNPNRPRADRPAANQGAASKPAGRQQPRTRSEGNRTEGGQVDGNRSSARTDAGRSHSGGGSRLGGAGAAGGAAKPSGNRPPNKNAPRRRPGLSTKPR